MKNNFLGMQMTNKNGKKTVETLTHDEARRKHIPIAKDDKIHLPPKEPVASILGKEQHIMEIVGPIKTLMEKKA
ncbi:MAG: hypothetical protein WCO89_05180 [Syntrophus sp. (in: bacteria)]